MLNRVLIWSMLVSTVLSAICFTTHALTFHFDATTGKLYEPFFFMVLAGYGFLALTLVALCILVGNLIVKWFASRKRD